MINFPVPYPEELLYSLVARTGVRQGIVSPKRLLDEVFGSRSVIATLDLPNHVADIARWLPERFDAEQLVYKHTLFPIYAPFVPENRRKRCLIEMFNRSKGSVHLALGLSASRVKTASAIKYCPQCLKNQLLTRGEYYWQRSWQVTGVESCLDHGSLVETQIARPLVSRHEYIAASPDLCPNRIQALSCIQSDLVARQVKSLLNRSGQKSPSFTQWTQYYKRLAERGGFVRGQQQIDHALIINKVLNTWTADWLQENHLMSSGKSAQLSWLLDMFRKHRKSFSYLQHIVVNQAMLTGDWDIGEVIDEVSRFSSKLSRSSETKICSSSLQYMSDQQQWLSLLTMHSPKTARSFAKSLYARLYRNCREWLINTNSQYVSKALTNYRVIDWQQRDQALLIKIKQINRDLVNDDTGPRRSKMFYLRKLGCVSTLSKKLHLMPMSEMLLTSCVESVEQYQIRRIKNSHQELFDQLLTRPAKWQVMRKANVSKERITTGANVYLNKLTGEHNEI